MKKSGFTLIELMVVIALIGLLAAIVLPRFVDVTKDAEVAQIQANERNIQTAIQMYLIKEDKDIESLFESDGGTIEESIKGMKKSFSAIEKYYGKSELPCLPGTDRNLPFHVLEESLNEAFIEDTMTYYEILKYGWFITDKGNVYPIVPKSEYGIRYDEFI